MHEVYLGLGSNLGDREQQLRQAVRLVDERVGRVVRQAVFHPDGALGLPV